MEAILADFDRVILPGITHWNHPGSAARLGYVETLFGRRIVLPDIRGGSGPRRAAAERQAINAPM